jgi:hypothetical protein
MVATATFIACRWYRYRFPGDPEPTDVWAERLFDLFAEAQEYAERRTPEIAPRRVSLPVPSSDPPGLWVVCVEPA